MSEENRRESVEQAPDAVNEEEARQEERHIDLGSNLRKEPRQRKKVSRKGKALSAVLAVVVLAVLVIGLSLLLRPASGEDEAEDPIIQANSIKLLEGEEGSLVAVDFQTEDSFTMTASGDAYQVTGLDDEALNLDACRSLFLSLAELKGDEIVEENPADLSVYGLDTPDVRATLRFDSGNEYVFLLGDVAPTSVKRYLMEEGGNAVYLLNSYTAGKFAAPRGDYHVCTLNEVDGSNGKSLIIRRRGEEQWKIRKVENSTDTINSWKIIEPIQIDADTDTVSQLGASMEEIILGRYVCTVSSEAELAGYGLADPEISLTYVDQNNASRHIEIGDSDGNGSNYVRIDDSLDVYTTQSNYIRFAQELSDVNLIDRYFTMVNIAGVDTVVIEKAGRKYEMHIERKEVPAQEEGEEPEIEETYSLNGKIVEEKAFKNAYQSVIAINNMGIVQQDKVGEQPVLSVLYRFSNGNADLLYEYLPYDINNYAIRCNGMTYVYGRKDAVEKIWPALEMLESGEAETKE